MNKKSIKKIYLEKTIKGKKYKYDGEFCTTKKDAEIAKRKLKRKGFDVSIRKVNPTKKELDKLEMDVFKCLGVVPKRRPSKIYRIFFQDK